MSAILVEGDLLSFDVQFIAHQCNCISEGSAGLARHLFDKFPYANIYRDRSEYNNIYWSKPGEIYIRYPYKDKSPAVINMTSQFLPGGPGNSFELFKGVSITETEQMREALFLQCLKKITKIDLRFMDKDYRHGQEVFKSIAFPWRIGCGLAGGKWDRYKYVLDNFAKVMRKKDVDVYIVKRLEDD